MGLFGGRKPETRTTLLQKASRARGKGKRKKALHLYQQALQMCPGDHEILARLAPLQAESGQGEVAWQTFVEAAQGFQQQGFIDKAFGVYRQSTRYFAQEVELWERLADLNLQRKRPRDAVEVLCEGRRCFRRRGERSQAVQLLQQAFDIEPWRFDVTLDLAALEAQLGERAAALQRLIELATRCHGRELRRVRGLQFRLAPTPAAAWRWLRALLLGR